LCILLIDVLFFNFSELYTIFGTVSKPFVISRKNILFTNTPRGAKASAVMFSLIETAKECGVNPFGYLNYVFTNAPKWDISGNPRLLDLLLPWNVSMADKS